MKRFKMTKKMIFLLLLFLMVLGAVNVNAQVRIGGSTPPHRSAILDLNFDSGTDTLGLLLPRVKLDSVSSSAPLPSPEKGLVVYNLTTDNGLNEGIYYNDGSGWYPVLSSAPVRSLELPIIFLRQPGFLWLGSEGELTDTLCFELAAEDKSNFTYRWYKYDPETSVSAPLTGEYAHNDTLFIKPSNWGDYGISKRGKVYQFYCVVASGSQYGISGTGGVVYGTGAWLANGKWINIAPANLGANQTKTVEEQMDYKPVGSPPINDVAYDPIVYGDWYQWGREKDGHQVRGVAPDQTYSGHLTALNGVGLDSLNTDNGQIKSGPDFDAIYGKFIQRDGAPYDWRQYPETADSSAISPANNWTWGNPVKGITELDPCSELSEDTIWRVPTQFEWSQIRSNNTWVWSEGNTRGYEIKPGGDNKPTSLFLPAAGIRNRSAGKQTSVGFNGSYWSSTVTSTASYALVFDSGSGVVVTSRSRSDGFPIRCVSEY
ncbi:MAG: fibrobacter succinogenes major paralogous domain-containing protein [Dysgonamonadaceae bacterium]|jgi:hypothetical protein|nr:fibrobacter succinogenes major paralogous domain-containing protein [Dysgonamonadaceae bacterium]